MPYDVHQLYLIYDGQIMSLPKASNGVTESNAIIFLAQ